MAAVAYRFSAPAIVTVHEGNKVRLRQVSPGDVFMADTPEPDRNGMVGGTCNHNFVLVFSRDLEERAEPVDESVDSEYLMELV